ncbi:Disulfide bond reductase DsbH precursor [Symmachiella macrocystis]|uniref:Disulfide bond reductase DsbH n=1 Tax=Symmachiella macrocystis TaxID=2527985 RepID=A0A5C6B9Y7_9PLAN|nr:thioredoxin family protein [Symmachiella macrocystis]TWU07334.1 Disulfide bond reductase DsbH precursor [Symmachiella macrocystis]
MLSMRVLRLFVATAFVAVGFSCFSLMGCGSETSATDSSSTELAPKGIWTTDYKAALAKAKKEGKDVLINFTGSDWCGYCIELQNKVFQYKVFSDGATKDFVLLEVDFPNDASLITPQVQAQNNKLQQKFSIEGFPAILLVDEEGRPYARTGYQPVGPQKYVEHLSEFTDLRKKRDAAFAAAGKLSGIEKALKLDEALSDIPPQWMFTSYADVVEEIVSLDADNQAGLRKEYADQLLISKLQVKLKEIQTLLQTTGNVDAALKKIDEIDKEFAGFAPAREVGIRFRLQLLQMEERNDDVLKLANSLLADKATQEDLRLPILSAKLQALVQLDKIEDALEVTGRMRQEFTKDKQLSARILIARADLLHKLKQEDEAREALKEARVLGGAEMEATLNQVEKQIFQKPQEGPDLKAPAN